MLLEYHLPPRSPTYVHPLIFRHVLLLKLLLIQLPVVDMVAQQGVDVHIVVAGLEPVLVVLVLDTQEEWTTWLHLEGKFFFAADNLVAI